MLGISADPAFSAAMDPPSGGLCEEQRVLWAAFWTRALTRPGSSGMGPSCSRRMEGSSSVRFCSFNSSIFICRPSNPAGRRLPGRTAATCLSVARRGENLMYFIFKYFDGCARPFSIPRQSRRDHFPQMRTAQGFPPSLRFGSGQNFVGRGGQRHGAVTAEPLWLLREL